jgi:hypothetical protein
VKLFRLLSSIRCSWRGGWADPVSRYGAVFRGTYQLGDKNVSGIVAHFRHVSDRPPASIVVFLDDKMIGGTEKFEDCNRNWRFAVGVDFTPQDILHSRLKVFALDRVGGRSALLADGTAQLAYLKRINDRPADVELTVDFSHGGNSTKHVREGWYGPTTEHTWTEGKYSTLEVAFTQPGSKYRLQIRAWPFVVPERLPEQRLAISVGEWLIGKFSIKPGKQVIECDIPPDLTETGNVVIRFDHPDAAKPCDLSDSRDGRTLGVAFQTITLRRILAPA